MHKPNLKITVEVSLELPTVQGVIDVLGRIAPIVWVACTIVKMLLA